LEPGVNNMSELLNTAPETRSILSASNTTKYKDSMNDIFGFKQSKIIIFGINNGIQIKLNSLLKNWQCNVQCFYSAEIIHFKISSERMAT
jgi:hypothetical protein